MKTGDRYPDGLILAVTKKYDLEREKEKPLSYRIKTDRQHTALADREIYPGITMRIPSGFRKLAGNGTGSGSLVRGHPETIFASGCGTVDFTFDRVRSGTAEPTDVRDRFIAAMKVDYPQTVIYEKGVRNNGEAETCWFEYRSPAVGGEIYGIMYFFPGPDGEMMIGIFRCAWRDQCSWKPYVLKMLDTIKRIAEENTV